MTVQLQLRSGTAFDFRLSSLRLRIMRNLDTKEQWDDLPENTRVVGKRTPPTDALTASDGLQRLANDLAGGRVTWPKGVWRFRTHE